MYYLKLILIIKLILNCSYIETSSQYDNDEVMGPLSKYNFNTLFSTEKTVIGPRCIPLTSKNIAANPYHYSLVSRKGAEVRRGIGKPLILEHPPLLCPIDSPSECSFNVEKSLSVTITSSVSVNIGKSSSLASSVGSTITRGQSNLFSRAIGKSIEKSLTNSITDSDEESVSDQLTKDISKSHEKSTGISLGKSKENSQTITVTEDKTSGNQTSKEITVSNAESVEESESNTKGGSSSHTGSVTVGGSVGIFYSVSASATYSYSNENNWSNSKSKSRSNSKTNSESLGQTDSYSISNVKSQGDTSSYSSSSTEENHASDSISYSLSSANTLVKGKSKQNSTSEATSTGYNINDNYQASNETSIANQINDEQTFVESINTDKSESFSQQLTVSSNQAYHVRPGECKILVCLPFVISAAIPYTCIGNDLELYEMHTEIMLIDNSTKIECVQSLIDCMDKNQMNTFINTNMEFVQTTNPNYWHTRLEYGRNIEALDEELIILKSSNSFYTLVQNPEGNLAIKNFEKIIWENEMNYYFNRSRIRINEKGHFIQEAQNIFSVEDYRINEWITVWSSSPINHNVTIGIPRMNGKSYVLVLSDSGILNLYDAVGAIIWCSDIGCQHKLGYKFPEIYLVPTIFLTPKEENNHNSISSLVNKSSLMSFRSMDYSINVCTGLKSNEAIVSENERFKLILEDSGNLIIKDDVRTMWESVSGHIPHAVSPYFLNLTPMCQLRITSKNGYVIWFSAYQSKVGECYIDFDEFENGRLVVRDRNKTEVWQSWPTQNNNLGITFTRPFQHKYVPCDGKNLNYTHSLTIDNHLNNDESLTSQNGLWDFVILNSKLVIRHLNVIKGTIYKADRKLNGVVFKSNGMLQLNAKKLAYEYKYLDSNLINDALTKSKLVISNDGDLSITDDLNNILWKLKLKDLNKNSLSDLFKVKLPKF